MQDASDLLVGELLRQTLRLIHDAFESAFFGRDGARLLAAMSAFTPSADLAERLADVFGRFPEVLAVYLFGSVAEGRAGLHSDLDLAVVPASPAARGRRLDLLAALIAAGLDDVDLAILDGADVVLRFEAVRPTVSYTRARGSTTAPITRAPYASTSTSSPFWRYKARP